MHKKTIFFCFIIVLTNVLYAQELNFKVTINATQVQTMDRSVFQDMETSFAFFLNSRKWTTNSFKPYEKIKGTLFLNITSMPSIGRFTANAQITSSRTIYNSTYESLLLNFADRQWEFEYIESLPLEYNDNTYMNNLTSLLAFYAYIILGMDYDSFSEMGGSPYFQKALIVVNNAQLSARPGWQALEGNLNRYALVENLTNSQMDGFRKMTYQYHRLALDIFDKNPDKSRQIIADGLKKTLSIWNLYPSSTLLVAFFDAKSSELVNIFSKGTSQIRHEVYEILSTMDPKREIYKKIISN